MIDNNTTELLPCPICGGQPDFQHFNVTPNVQGRIICTCGLSLVQGKNDTDDDMRIIWNTRSDYAVQAENEREKALEELVRDMWREMLTCPDYATSPCMTKSICERVRNLEIEVN